MRPLANGNLLVGGNFIEAMGKPRNGLAILSPDGRQVLDEDFGGGATLAAYPGVWTAWECADGRLAIGGGFYEFGGKSTGNFAMLMGALRLPTLPISSTSPSTLWGIEGHRYELQRSDSLSPVEWSPVESWNGSNGFIPLPSADNFENESFYRLLAE